MSKFFLDQEKKRALMGLTPADLGMSAARADNERAKRCEAGLRYWIPEPLAMIDAELKRIHDALSSLNHEQINERFELKQRRNQFNAALNALRAHAIEER